MDKVKGNGRSFHDMPQRCLLAVQMFWALEELHNLSNDPSGSMSDVDMVVVCVCVCIFIIGAIVADSLEDV